MASDTDIGEIKVALRQLTETIEDLLNYGRTTVQDSRGKDCLNFYVLTYSIT